MSTHPDAAAPGDGRYGASRSTDGPVPRAAPTGWRALWRRFRRHRLGLVGLAVMCAFVLTAVLARRIAPVDPMGVGAAPFLPPDWRHLMGTDNLGRDVLSGVIYGTRVSLAVGFLATASSTMIGVAVGGLAGYHGAAADALLMRVTELFQVLPRFFLGLVVVALAGPGIGKIIFVIGILSWPPLARVVRAEFLALREREFVDAARAVGASAGSIIFKQILPNALPSVVVMSSLEVAQAILLEAGLSFIGLGDPNLISWGTMLNNAQAFMRQAWWVPVFPGLAIFVTVLGLNFFGDGLNAALSPRLQPLALGR